MTPKQLKVVQDSCQCTGMFCLHHDVFELAAWLSGYGCGILEETGIDPFEGFNEWFARKMGWDFNVWWLSIVRNFSDQEPRKATLAVLALIEECVADISTKPGA
jgi:hypothetical protein